MAKLFPIGIEVEEVAVGSVLRILNKTPGVAKLHLNLLNEGPTVENETPVSEVQATLPPVRRAKEGSSQMVVAQVLKLTPAHNNILKEALVRSGFSASSLPSIMTKMKELGFVKSSGVGTWRITDKGIRHYGFDGVKALPNKQGGRGAMTQNGLGVRRLVLTALNEKELVAKEITRILKENEYSPKNMTGTVGKMRQEGLIQSTGGLYSITDQGREIYNQVAANPMEHNS